MNATQRGMFPGTNVMDRNGSIVGMQISKSGGLITLANGFTDMEGFYVTVAPGGTEGLIVCVPMNGDPTTPVTLPVYKGWMNNPILLQSVSAGGHTAVTVYWGK
jgi:hypothetical protein